MLKMNFKLKTKNLLYQTQQHKNKNLNILINLKRTNNLQKYKKHKNSTTSISKFRKLCEIKT